MAEICEDAVNLSFAWAVEGLVDEPVAVDGGKEVGLCEASGVEFV